MICRRTCGGGAPLGPGSGIRGGALLMVPDRAQFLSHAGMKEEKADEKLAQHIHGACGSCPDTLE